MLFEGTIFLGIYLIVFLCDNVIQPPMDPWIILCFFVFGISTIFVEKL